MKSPLLLSKIILTGFIVLIFCLPASAAITLYDKDETTFSVDGYFNVFFANSKSDVADTQQSRVKMGFLPNTIGFNFSKQVGDLKMGGRSSFWVSINDDSPTDTAIDVRQFYGTIDGSFGQVLLGKDFALFNRTNIFLDEILLGFGKTGGVSGQGVSFGNIGSGYTYPLPVAQITYRTPDLSGFKLAVGIVDPAATSRIAATTTTPAVGSEEDTPRIEAEATFSRKFMDDKASMTAWAGFLNQSSENAAGTSSDSNGVSYGLNLKYAGASLTASGFDGEGLSILGPWSVDPNTNVDNTGFLVQGSYTIDKVRLVASYGKNEDDAAGVINDTEDETVIGAVFYSFNSNLILVADYSVEEMTTNDVKTEEINTLALGAVITF